MLVEGGYRVRVACAGFFLGTWFRGDLGQPERFDFFVAVPQFALHPFRLLAKHLDLGILLDESLFCYPHIIEVLSQKLVLSRSARDCLSFRRSNRRHRHGWSGRCRDRCGFCHWHGHGRRASAP